jgi:hypothetical protein
LSRPTSSPSQVKISFESIDGLPGLQWMLCVVKPEVNARIELPSACCAGQRPNRKTPPGDRPTFVAGHSSINRDLLFPGRGWFKNSLTLRYRNR